MSEISDILNKDDNRSFRDELLVLIKSKADRDEVYNFVKSNDNKKGNYAAWIFTNVMDQDTKRILDYQDDMILWLPEVETNGILRSLVRSVAQFNAPQKNETEWIDLSFKYLIGIEYEIAVKAHAMQVLHLYCKRYPELSSELRTVIEEGMEIYSTGLKARGRNILKSLDKIIAKTS